MRALLFPHHRRAFGFVLRGRVPSGFKRMKLPALDPGVWRFCQAIMDIIRDTEHEIGTIEP